MNNISIQIKNFFSNSLSLKSNLVVLFYIGLLILIGFEALVVKSSLGQALASKKDQPPSRSVQKVRVNFMDYNAGIEKINSGKNFKPSLSPQQNPFKNR